MKKLITICAVVGLMLSATGVSWATTGPVVLPPPQAPEWWNFPCEYYAYGWWEADIAPVPGGPALPPDFSPLPDPLHWGSNFLQNTDFKASVVDNVVTIDLLNRPRPDLYKEIFIYLGGTTTAGVGETISGILDADGGTFTGAGMFGIGGGEWHYAMLGEIHPQPSYVNLTVTVPGLRSVRDIWAGENCLPEPATIGLLGLGSLVLLRKRRA